MRILLSSLQEHIDVTETPEKIAEILTTSGLEVDAIEYLKPTFTGIVAARVMKAERHPNADKLTLAEVSDGKNSFQVVCGAPNCREGLVTAFAPIGASLYPDGTDKPIFNIAKATLRGVESFGMLCSASELGLSKESDGIVELDSDMPLGTPLEKAFADVMFEISLTPNLGHVMSVRGVARELSALTGIPLKKRLYDIDRRGMQQFTINNKAPELCQRYSALHVSNVKVAPSPFWLRLKLERSGLNSINTVVDVTNWIAHEFGQPLHAFDAATFEGTEIAIVKASGQESTTLIDGALHNIPKDACLIQDSKKVLAVAGVMGGLSSAVSPSTQSLFIESALFSPSSVRKTKKALNVNSDSAKRFERGTDPNGTAHALLAAFDLLEKLSPEVQCIANYDVQTASFLPKTVTCRLSRTSQLLGFEVSSDEMETAFTRFGFENSFDGKDLFTVKVPQFRHDIREEVDLIEEVLRIVGMKTDEAPSHHTSSQYPNSPLFTFEREIRARLLTQGLQEFITCNLISPKMVETVKNHPIKAENLVKVMNPMSEEQSILRPSLLPGFLDIIKRNNNARTFTIRGFEIGSTHFRAGDIFTEQDVVGIVLTGKAEPASFDLAARDVDFLDLKGILENLFIGLGLPHLHFAASELSCFHPGRQARIMQAGLQVGTIGELHPAILRKVDIVERVLFAELNIQDLLKLRTATPRFEPLAAFPASERDWTINVPESLSFSAFEKAIREHASELLESVSLVAIFRHEKLGADKKNMSVRFVFRDREKTIGQKEVDEAHQKIVAGVQKSLGL